MRRFQKFSLPLWGSLTAAVLLAGGITLLALWCQPNALRSVLSVFRAQPLLIVLNALPVGLVLLAFACLFRNVFFGAAITNFLVCALSIANRAYVLETGKIVMSGAAREMLEDDQVRKAYLGM